jgi:hypothetical protein
MAKVKYEYKVVRFHHYNKDESGLNEEDLINKFANESWELLFPQLYNESFTYLYFKRELDGESKQQ